MKTCKNHLLRLSVPRYGLVAMATLFLHLDAVSTQADPGVTSYTSTGYYIGVPYPGDTLTFATNNVQVRNMLSLKRVQSSDARLTRRVTVLTHGYYHPDGSGTIYGTWTGEVGSWDLTDLANPKFTATAGFWEGSWQGLMQADGSWEIKILGRGTGGAVDGLEMSETATRGPGAIDNPAIPINYTGIVGPAGALNVEVIDDFDDGDVSDWGLNLNAGTGQVSPLAQQLKVGGDWLGVRTLQVPQTGAWAILPRSWQVEDGQTIEVRVDVVGLSETVRHADLWFWDQSSGRGYAVLFGKDYLAFDKTIGGRAALIGWDFVALKHTRVVLALALTAAGDNLILTVRVFDKDNQNALLYERSVVDTPAADPVVSNDELKEKLGMDLTFFPDPAGRPQTSGAWVSLGLFQYTDGTLPPAEVTFDNLELRTYEVPLLAIDKAVQLRWPASAFPLTVEGAPAVQGPWLPVLQPVLESAGVKQVIVPDSEAMRFFRLK